MRDRIRATATLTAPGDSDPDMDEALRRARTKPAQAVRAILLDTADALTATDPTATASTTTLDQTIEHAATERYGTGPTGQAARYAAIEAAPTVRPHETDGELSLRLRAAAGALR